ncbi:hypothetical protein ACQKKK_25885 [Peribacillus sp. NPDC006672]|uniref:hypothetical protein n=1 Tax=Peribacillus sp. NPDC006672 TaxID=3390606 RepID=UPI003CFCCDB3
MKFIGDLFKRYAIKTKKQAKKKGMFDKKGVEEVENLHSKARVLLYRVAPNRG